MRTVLKLAIAGLVAVTITRAEIVDSVVAVVGNTAIKHSDVIRDVRMTEFLNKTPVNLDRKLQEEAMNRLIDQALIRQELKAGSYEVADAARVEAAMKPVRESHGGSDGFQRALQTYGVSQEDLAQRLQWELTALDFIQLRFGNGPVAEQASAQAAPDKAAPDKAAGKIEDAPSSDAFIMWLDAARKNERITTKPERLQ